MISDDELSRMEMLAHAARPGTWVSYIEGRDHSSGSDFIMVAAEDEKQFDDIEFTGVTHADQDFIASARQDVPALIAEVRRLRAMLGKHNA